MTDAVESFNYNKGGLITHTSGHEDDFTYDSPVRQDRLGSKLNVLESNVDSPTIKVIPLYNQNKSGESG